MTKNMKKFLELVSAKEELGTRLKSADKDGVIALAKELGVALGDADFEAATVEISDDELDAVAGGKKCYCAMGGGGTGENSNSTNTCACVGAGYGSMKDGTSRCTCVLGGYGDNQYREVASE